MLPLRLRGGHAVEHQVFFANPRVSDEAVLSVAIEAAGLANNVNYSEAAIMASIAGLDEVGVAHTDAGANRALREHNRKKLDKSQSHRLGPPSTNRPQFVNDVGFRSVAQIRSLRTRGAADATLT